MNRRIQSALALSIVLVLAGCASWDRDLDTRRYPGPAVALDDAQAQEISSRVRQLRTQGAEIRARLALETDRGIRIRHYRALHALSKELGPLERQLAAAGRIAGLPALASYS